MDERIKSNSAESADQKKKISDLSALVQQMIQNSTREKDDNSVLKLQLSEEAAALRRAEFASSSGSARVEKQEQEHIALQHQHAQQLQFAEAATQQQSRSGGSSRQGTSSKADAK